VRRILQKIEGMTLRRGIMKEVAVCREKDSPTGVKEEKKKRTSCAQRSGF